MCHEAFAWCGSQLLELGFDQVWDRDRVIVILDHGFPAATERMALGHITVRHLVEQLGVGTFLGHAGICHQVLVERGLVRPGQLVLGTDSHSCTYGAVGAAGAGIGLTDMTYVLATGELWMRVPETIRFVLAGDPGPGTMSKDVVLYLAGRYGTDVAQYGSIEYAGPLADRLTISSRMTMSNMGVELGAKFAFFAADTRTQEFYVDATGESVEPFGPEPGALVAQEHVVDLDGLGPQVALPHDPSNVRPVEDADPGGHRPGLPRLVHQRPFGRPRGRGRDLDRTKGAPAYPAHRHARVPSGRPRRDPCRLHRDAARRGRVHHRARLRCVPRWPFGCGGPG